MFFGGFRLFEGGVFWRRIFVSIFFPVKGIFEVFNFFQREADV